MSEARGDEQHERYVTRQEGIDAAQKIIGLPLKRSRVEKDALSGRGPKPAAWYGKRPLYRYDDFIAYARALVSLKPRRLPGSRRGLVDEQADRA